MDTAIYLEVHPDPSEGISGMFIVTEAGQLCRSGMNAAGLVLRRHFATYRPVTTRLICGMRKLICGMLRDAQADPLDAQADPSDAQANQATRKPIKQ
jgi:hypothetical protein